MCVRICRYTYVYVYTRVGLCVYIYSKLVCFSTALDSIHAHMLMFDA